MIVLTYQIDETKFMHAARALWSYRGIGDVGNLCIAALTCALGLALIVMEQQIGWVCVGASAIFVSITLLRNILWRSGFRKMVKYSAPITAKFSADEVHTNSAEGLSSLPWSTFTKYAETPDYFFLMLPRRGFSIIPKQACKDDWEVETLRELITNNLPRAKMRWT